MKEISELPSGSVVKRRSAKSEDMWFESSCFTFLAKRITAFFQLKFSTEVVDEVLKNKRKLQESIIKRIYHLLKTSRRYAPTDNVLH